MSPLVELNLSLILFLPWFLVLSVLYWLFPRQPRDWRRRLFDAGALLLALLAFLAGIYWSYDNADPQYGRIWQQILATVVGYGAYLLVLTVAFFMRRALLAKR